MRNQTNPANQTKATDPDQSKTDDVRFNRFHVAKGKTKARVWYSLDNRVDGRRCVTLYAKDYGRGLGQIFADEYQNDTDTQTDYFDTGRVVLFQGHPLYYSARQRAEANQQA